MSHLITPLSNSKLMTVLKFTPQDLLLNKLRKLSETQLEYQKKQLDLQMKRLYQIIYSIMLVFMLVRALEILFTSEKAQKNAQDLILYFIIITLIYYFLTKWGGNLINQKRKNFLSTAAQIECFHGKIELFPSNANINFEVEKQSALKSIFQDLLTTYSLKIAGEDIAIDQQISSAFEDGKIYNIYTVNIPSAQNTINRLIISAEQLNS